MVFPSSQVFNGGQMTDLPPFAGPLDGTELIEIVAPGNLELGVNYSVTTALLAAIINAFGNVPTIITAGATAGSHYAALTSDTRILLNKTVASASFVDLGLATARGVKPIMVRDLKGDADVNNITVSFTGTVDGLASPIVINAPYGGWVFNPLANGNWYLTST